jgi:hypothetical protein
MAIDLALQYSADAAREIMGHDPSTRTLEDSYLEFAAMRHLTALMIPVSALSKTRVWSLLP